MRFAVYKASTGSLVSTGDCISLDSIAVGAGEAIIAVSGDFSHLTHRIVNGVPTTYTNEQAASFAEFRPGLTWDASGCIWVDARTLVAQKIAAWTRIKAAREGAIDANLATPHGTFDCKAKDRTNITDAVLMLQTLASVGTPTTIDFTLADNTTATLTTSQMVTVGLLLGQKVQTAHGIARVRRAQIEAATTVAEVTAVVW